LLPIQSKCRINEVFEGLKVVIHRKWGDTAPISKTIFAIAEDPGFKAQAAVLQWEVAAVKAPMIPKSAWVLRQLVAQIELAASSGRRCKNDPIQDGRQGAGVTDAENGQIGSNDPPCAAPITVVGGHSR
jgi:hypothetical protein